MLYRHHSEMIKSLFDHNLDAVVAVDPQGRFTAVNPAGEDLSGYSTAELLAMDVTQILTPESVPAVLAAVSQALQGRSMHVEARFACKDGRLVDVIVSGGPIIVDGRPVGVFGIARDVTEHKRLGDEIRRLNERLEQRVAERTEGLEAANRQLAAEVAERRRVETQLHHRSGFQRLIAELATDFIRLRTEQIDEGIRHALERIGRFAGVDRSCLCQYSDDQSSLTCTHEWCAPGVPPSIQDVQADPTSHNPWITPQLLGGQVVHVPRVADLPAEAAAERKAFSAWGTQSFVMVPLALAGRVVGVVGFDSVHEVKCWPDDSIDLLQIAGEMLVNAVQRQRAERALQQSETRYRALVEQMPGIVYAGALDGRYRLQYVSSQVQTMVGYSPEEALAGTHFWIQRLHPEDRERARVSADAPLGRPFTREYRVIARDGRVVWIRDDAVILPDPAGGAPLMQGVALDITDRVRAEQALRESEQKYRSIVENTHDVIMLTRCDGIVIYMSPATRQVLGYEPEELVGRQPWITHPDDLARVHQMHRRALAGESGTNYEYRVTTKCGQTKWVSHSWSMVSAEGQSLIVSVVRDITERKAAQEQIERHEEQLRVMASELVLAEERERRRLAGDLHDDVGQLLALAQIRLGVLDRQAKGTSLAGPVAQLRDVVERASRATRSLTFQLCPPALYDLGFVPAAEWLAEDMQQRYGLRVEVVDDGADKPLDERLRIVLFRCLREVLINTAKHAGVDAATVQISRAGDWVRVEATDAGVGFDPHAVRSGTGRGYGLFSVEERLEYLGGRFAICSSPGGGTTVTLEAPLQLPPSQADTEAGS